MSVLAMKVEDMTSPMLAFVDGYSIEVMPRTAEKIENFQTILPVGTRVYVAHIDGTPIEAMRSTAARLAKEGFEVMPHFPARIIESASMLEDWISAYADVGVRSGLILAGGLDKPRGVFSDSMQLLKTGLYEKYGFTRLHVAGHPEPNKDIDPNGGRANTIAALKWKNDYAKDTDADMAIVTQFAFESGPVIEWANSLKDEGITLPIHIGIAGPAKLQTMIKFAMACGVGPSLRVLQRRARDLTKLLLPFKPNEILNDLAQYKAKNPQFNIEKVHFFPLGGILNTTDYISELLKGYQE